MSFSVGRVQWEYAAPLLRNVREKVFICEWRIPKNIEFDRKDHCAFHVLVCDDFTQEPVATGRILSTGAISRIAVLRSYRKSDAIKKVMHGLLTIARDLEITEVYIYSPLELVAYFRKFNFVPEGSIFMEVGRPKQRMSCVVDDVSGANHPLTH